MTKEQRQGLLNSVDLLIRDLHVHDDEGLPHLQGLVMVLVHVRSVVFGWVSK